LIGSCAPHAGMSLATAAAQGSQTWGDLVTTSQSYTTTDSIMVGAKVTFEAGFPLGEVVSGKLTLEVSTEFTHTWSTELITSITTQVSNVVTADLPAGVNSVRARPWT
jgi:hypothetical protein